MSSAPILRNLQLRFVRPRLTQGLVALWLSLGGIGCPVKSNGGPPGFADLTLERKDGPLALRLDAPPGYASAYVVDHGVPSGGLGGCVFILKIGEELADPVVRIELETARANLLSNVSPVSIDASPQTELVGPLRATTYTLKLSQVPAGDRTRPNEDWHSTAGTMQVSPLPERGQKLTITLDRVSMTTDSNTATSTLSGTLEATYDGLTALSSTRACPNILAR